MMAAEKRMLAPMVNVSHNDDDSGFKIEVDLAGASKQSVDLDMGSSGFCVKGEGADFRYESCYRLAHEVVSADATAKFESGLLRISVPFKDGTRGTKVKVQ